MMKKIVFLLMFALALPLQAQEKALMKATYKASFRNSISGNQWQDYMCLSIGKSSSHFYSVNALRNARLQDSIKKAGGSMSDYMNIMEANGNKEAAQTYHIFKQYSQNTIIQTDIVGRERLKTITKDNEIKWTLVKKDSVVANHKCQQAKAHYLGRTWKVWYAPDLPSNDGPWKLCGLPGLILKAEDANGDFSFVVKDILKGGNEKIIMNFSGYKECAPKKLMQLYKMKVENPVAFLKNTLPPGVEIILDEAEKRLMSKKRKACLIEVYE